MNKQIVFIADFFVKDVFGGGEIHNEELIKILKEDFNCEVKKAYADRVNLNFLEDHKDYYFIIGNFCRLHEDIKKALQVMNYVIYEHDHKYLKSRNPATYPNFKVPPSEIINYEFYKNAKAVFCQSTFHKGIVEGNLGLDNIENCSGNLWPNNVLDLIDSLRNNDKKPKASIMLSPIEHKNTADAIKFCQVKEYDYELIPQMSYRDFLKKLSANEKFVFLPKTPETLSRVVIEARMMNVSVVTNNLVGASKEPWFELKGKNLIEHIKTMRTSIPKKVLEVFEK